MKAVHGDSSHVVHRLESFSDVVIGFALAQTAITMVVPPNPAEFFAHPFGVVAYLLTFSIVARFWWVHGEIFRTYFVPDRLSIFVNFCSLAMMGLFVFSLQLWLHPDQTTIAQNQTAKAYFLCAALTFSLLAVLRLLGVRNRWEHLTPWERRAGVAISLRTLCLLVGVLVGALASPGNGVPQGSLYVGERIAALPLDVGLGAVGGVILGWIVGVVMSRSTWGSAEKQGAS